MTLKEEFLAQLKTATPPLNRPHYQANSCVLIAEDFAIDFVDWLANNCETPRRGVWTFSVKKEQKKIY